MEVDPWEALDLDDSDLPSLIRPCKRRRSTSLSARPAANPNSQPHSSQHPEENRPERQQASPSTSRSRTIPGPAGAVQAAMLRKDLDRENQNFLNHQEGNREGFSGNHHGDGVISTQNYIQRAMEGTPEFDEDFDRRPWLSALDFLGSENGVIHGTPISSIMKCVSGEKIARVVAVIKSCTPNGFGDLIVLLKDPTGTIGASIHHKVLSDSEFGKNLTIGAVVILQKVAMFAPTRSTQYLNVTRRNLVKVFCRDNSSTSKLNSSRYPVQYDDPGKHCGKGKAIEEMPTMQNMEMEDVEKRQHTRKTENLQNLSVIQRQSLFNGGVQSNNRANINLSAALREPINLTQDACNELPEHVIGTRITTDHQECEEGRGEKDRNLEGNLLNETNNVARSVTKSIGEEIQGTDEVQMQRQPLILKDSLPQWTDEQLDELFADDEDNGSLL